MKSSSSRTRLIFGTPGEVLPRLLPGAYDLVSTQFVHMYGAAAGIMIRQKNSM